jgi:hypothetical protein
MALIAAGFSAPAEAAPRTWNYVVGSGATYITGLNSTVTSSPTAQSSVTGGTYPRSASNATASVAVNGVLTAGAVETKNSSAAVGDDILLTSYARTAGVKLLGGLVTADAVETTGTLKGLASDGSSSSAVNTKFVGLKVVGVTLPVNIPKNYTVNVGGIAQLSLNTDQTRTNGSARNSQGWGLALVLLKAYNGAPAGAQVFLNPVSLGLAPAVPAVGPGVGGFAYGTKVGVTVDGVASVQSGPTAQVNVPSASSGGATLKNATVGLNVPNVAVVGAIQSSTVSSKTETTADVVTQTGTAGLNLLNGLITADAVSSRAHSAWANGAYTGDMSSVVTNLVIAGKPISINVAPNTTIEIAGIATVTINEQGKGGRVNQVRALHVVLTTAQAGLPAGTSIEVATSATWIP